MWVLSTEAAECYQYFVNELMHYLLVSVVINLLLFLCWMLTYCSSHVEP